MSHRFPSPYDRGQPGAHKTFVCQGEACLLPISHASVLHSQCIANAACQACQARKPRSLAPLSDGQRHAAAVAPLPMSTSAAPRPAEEGTGHSAAGPASVDDADWLNQALGVPVSLHNGEALISVNSPTVLSPWDLSPELG